MTRDVIDVWNLDTFDGELRAFLIENQDTVRDYFTTSRENWLSRELSDHTGPYPDNPHAGDYIRLAETIMPLMETRAIRGWHYTRMTDRELEALRRDGIHVSSLEAIRTRFNAQVEAGVFSQAVADGLFAASPYQSDQHDSRAGKFWMTSHPLDVEDGGVELLLGNWGGEAAYFWLRDPELIALVAVIGRPRVLEVVVPIAATRHAYSAGEAVLATFGRSLGCKPEKKAFDLYSTAALPPEALVATHTEGDATYARIGLSYPDAWIDPDIGRWDEMEAELERRRGA